MSTSPSFRLNDLPVELQREIFTTAALTDPSSALRLALVARHVNAWTQPLIYDTVTLGSDDTALFLRTLNSRPREFFALYVKRLCLSVSVSADDAVCILSVCSGVVHLALWIDYLGAFPDRSVSPLVSHLHLLSLSMELKHFMNLCLAPVNPHDSWWRSLTHLDIIFWTNEISPIIPGLDRLVSLTHLALRPREMLAEESLACIFSVCRRLQVLVVLLDEFDLMLDPVPFADRRVVFMPYPDVVQDWEAPSRGLPDTWSRAEELIRGHERIGNQPPASI
ncbi:hypothetical protein BDQ12DRAFT_723782 [Crucibulum laeve]|uniref:F-box domain-containing protein n=1 Tax=Crucibulum laeve TaxID=68775 RepID=A0A5C3LXR1_9AGAR|nr:hypothetical protein BDQ12DRAFT_723782 [Crucibulum laeve]